MTRCKRNETVRFRILRFDNSQIYASTTMDLNSGAFSRQNGAFTNISKKNVRLSARATSMLVLEVILRFAWLQLVLKITKDLTPFHNFTWLDLHVLFDVNLHTSNSTNELSEYRLQELELV